MASSEYSELLFKNLYQDQIWKVTLVGNDDADLLSVLSDKVVADAKFTAHEFVRRGAVKCLLVWATRKGWTNNWSHLNAFNCDLASEVAKNGNLAMLTLLHEKSVSWSETTINNAAQYGHLDCMVYAHENGCPCSATTFSLAASKGNLLCLQYLFDHGCPWDIEVCNNAARGGKLNCLQYLHENGCPWDSERICTMAVNNLECLMYAHTHGGVCTMITCEEAARGHLLACHEYARANRTPPMK